MPVCMLLGTEIPVQLLSYKWNDRFPNVMLATELKILKNQAN